MVACGSCGAQSPIDGRFCGSCGAAIAPGGGGNQGVRSAALTTEAKTSRLAVAALILAFIPCLDVVGLILGIVALVRINDRSRELKGKGLAIAAIVVPPASIPVIGILAAIAIPNFIMFQARAKQTEAKVNLQAIYSDLTAYEAENGGRVPDNFQALGMQLSPNRRYAYFLGNDVSQPDLGGPYRLPPDLDSDPDQSGAVVFAVGNIDTDQTLDVWKIDSTGKLVHLQDDLQR